MHFGDVVTILPDGIRIEEKELEPIGIFDGCRAWGVWMPHIRGRQQPQGVSLRDHFLLSPFEYSSWPVLVRVELKLDHRRGTLRDATNVLKSKALNILSVDGVPTGHHHATYNIIGEALEIKHAEKDNVLKTVQQWADKQRHFANNDVWDYCNKRLAPAMLQYSKQLSDAILNAHKSIVGGFLRDTFVDNTCSGRGVLYSPSELPNDELRKTGSEQAPRAVHCTWLQELAFFWLYRNYPGDAIPLSYEARSCRLQICDEKQRERFWDKVCDCNPPFKAVAAINAYEQYMRVTLSSADEWSRTVSVTVPYFAKFDAERSTTIGFLNHLCTKVASSDFNIRKVSIATREMSSKFESSELSLLVSRDQLDKFSTDRMARLRDVAREALDTFDINDPEKPPVVSRLQARRVFLSTNYDWLKTTDPRHAQLRALAATYGFELVDGREPFRVQGFDPRGDNVTDLVIRLIRHCDAFLQIIPETAREDNKLQWLLFESGAARARELPLAVCVECTHADDEVVGQLTVEAWTNELKPGQGMHLIAFYGDPDHHDFDAENLFSAVRKAFDLLQSQTMAIA